MELRSRRTQQRRRCRRSFAGLRIRAACLADRDGAAAAVHRARRATCNQAAGPSVRADDAGEGAPVDSPAAAARRAPQRNEHQRFHRRPLRVDGHPHLRRHLRRRSAGQARSDRAGGGAGWRTRPLPSDVLAAQQGQPEAIGHPARPARCHRRTDRVRRGGPDIRGRDAEGVREVRPRTGGGDRPRTPGDPPGPWAT